MQKQVHGFVINFLTLHLCGYRNGFNAQQALLTVVESLRRGFGYVILMDFSKTFDTLKHNLVIAKPYASGLQHNG